MTINNITPDELEAEVRRIAAERPGNWYRGEGWYSSGTCSDGTEGCLIGQALESLGVDTVRLDCASPASAIGSILPDCGLWLEDVQQGNDNRATWGYAIEFADQRRG